MKKFKSIMMPLQGHSKSGLIWLYTTTKEDDYNNNTNLEFKYNELVFSFAGTSFKNSEKLILYIELPKGIISAFDDKETIPYETYLLYVISPIINELSKSYVNLDKNVREKAQFESQDVGQCFTKRSGIYFDTKKGKFILRINFCVPLVNAISVNAKSVVKAITEILRTIELSLKNINKDELNLFVKTYKNQRVIRKFIKENNLCSFIGNGSILPRSNGTNEPMISAIPFISPKELEVKIKLNEQEEVWGMGIPRGITVITGGGYSGKSTLLDSIEMGIYNHIPGDGREYVITDNSALKIYAEDGRPVSNINLTPFFKALPNNALLDDFTTLHASGSVSQATNIIEAINGECKLLLIDEDKSATNFMIRDKNMRLLVKNEPIIPFTDRVKELSKDVGVSTILVIGGSSEYLNYADNVILMNDYIAQIVNDETKKLNLESKDGDVVKAEWLDNRVLIPKETNQPFLYFRTLETENEKMILLDEYSSDISMQTALITKYQLNSLATLMERLLTNKEIDQEKLFTYIKEITNKLFDRQNTENLIPDVAYRFYDDVRPIDVLCCLNRMRGVKFKYK